MRYWYALHVSGCWNRNDPNRQVILEFKENNDGGGGVDSGEMDNLHAEDDSEEEEEVDNEFFLRPRLIILDVLDWDELYDDEETPEALAISRYVRCHTIALYFVRNPLLGKIQSFRKIFEQNILRYICDPLSIYATQESTSKLGHVEVCE